MSHRVGRTMVAAALAAWAWPAGLRADVLSEVVTHPYPGITLVKRTDTITGPTRQVKMNIVFVDLGAPEIRFKLTPEGKNLPPDNFGTAGWPTPTPRSKPYGKARSNTSATPMGRWRSTAISSPPFPCPRGATRAPGRT